MPQALRTPPYDSLLQRLEKALGTLKGDLERLTPGPQREELLSWCRDSRLAVLKVKWVRGALATTRLRES